MAMLYEAMWGIKLIKFCICLRDHLGARKLSGRFDGEINSGKIEDRVPFVEEATNPNST